jgi:hypothetical protein
VDLSGKLNERQKEKLLASSALLQGVASRAETNSFKQSHEPLPAV